MAKNGIIPARAGSSVREGDVAGRLGDHPRACGEQKVNAGNQFTIPGSSPRVRGAGRRRDGAGPVGGIIPARAGSSGGVTALGGAVRDHPRACGEQLCIRNLF